VRALRERVEHGVVWLRHRAARVADVVVERLARLYTGEWSLTPSCLCQRFVTGFNQACHAVTSSGDGVLIQTPAYPPFFSVPKMFELTLNETELTRQSDGSYTIDFDAFEATITDRTAHLILCNPHNPVGRVFRREELERNGRICLRHNVVICSDEITAMLIFTAIAILPIASLRTRNRDADSHTDRRPSKTFNVGRAKLLSGNCAHRELRDKFKAARCWGSYRM